MDRDHNPRREPQTDVVPDLETVPVFPEDPEIPGLTEPPGQPSIGVLPPAIRSTRPFEGPMPARLVVLFAVACGVVVANNYYAQPILDVIARDFGITTGLAGLVVTATQIGYAFGLVLIVPLGDLVDRRRLIPLVLVGATFALVGAAGAPTLGVLLASSLFLGLTTVVAQILVPFAATLAEESERGRVVGAVMSGLLLGILLARTVSGLISQIAGWHVVYIVAAVLTVVLIVVLWRELPRLPTPIPLTPESYRGLLSSVLQLLSTEPVLRRRSIYGALTFAAFNVFWTSAAFLLSRPPYGYNQAIIGLFGLLGAAGALTASVAGRLADRGWAHRATGGFLLAATASFGLLALGGQWLIPLVLGVVILDLGAQGTHITNQSEIYRLHPDARSRLTTAYMTSYFIGGALGSATSAFTFGRYGWVGVSGLGAFYCVAALGLWLFPDRVHSS